jgi:hypothetical protein
MVSYWRPPPKPPLKRRCARCNRLFSPKRCDAVFCSHRCRTAIYRKRLADDAKVDDRAVLTAHFRAEEGIDAPRALKALLKIALTKYGLRPLHSATRDASRHDP